MISVIKREKKRFRDHCTRTLQIHCKFLPSNLFEVFLFFNLDFYFFYFFRSESIYLWLGIRILSVDSAAHSPFFLGAEGSKTTIHSDQLSDLLRSVLNKHDPEDIARIFGCFARELGCHSFRKFGAEGLQASPYGPNPMAICDRLNDSY